MNIILYFFVFMWEDLALRFQMIKFTLWCQDLFQHIMAAYNGRITLVMLKGADTWSFTTEKQEEQQKDPIAWPWGNFSCGITPSLTLRPSLTTAVNAMQT